MCGGIAARGDSSATVAETRRGYGAFLYAIFALFAVRFLFLTTKSAKIAKNIACLDAPWPVPLA